MLKNPSTTKEVLRKAKLISFASWFAGRIARELWWTNRELSLVDIIPLWFSMLIYPLGYEE
jgi:hypothetical protein